MMFAYAENLEAYLIGQGCLFDQVSKSFGAGDGFAGLRIWEDFREIVDAYFHANLPFTGVRSLVFRSTTRQAAAAFRFESLRT
jgi:hypothetical protein